MAAREIQPIAPVLRAEGQGQPKRRHHDRTHLLLYFFLFLLLSSPIPRTPGQGHLSPLAAGLCEGKGGRDMMARCLEAQVTNHLNLWLASFFSLFMFTFAKCQLMHRRRLGEGEGEGFEQHITSPIDTYDRDPPQAHPKACFRFPFAMSFFFPFLFSSRSPPSKPSRCPFLRPSPLVWAPTHPALVDDFTRGKVLFPYSIFNRSSLPSARGRGGSRPCRQPWFGRRAEMDCLLADQRWLHVQS